MRVLVTGATGFVGRALVAKLRELGADVVAVGGPSSSEADHSLDVADAEQVRRLGGEKNIDAVAHLAGLAHRFGRTSDEEFNRVNVRGTDNIAVLAARLGVKHFLLISSTLVYGRQREEGPVTESD